MILCGLHGHKTKDGSPCRYRISDTAKICPHHNPIGSTAGDFQKKGALVRAMNQLPQQIQLGKLDTADSIRSVYSDLLAATLTQKHLERSRVEVAVKILSGAASLLQTEAVKELNEMILRSEGHGPALVILEGLKAGKMTRLPGVPARTTKTEEAGA